MNPIRAVLSGLTDVEGVIGSFVVTDEGGLVGTDLPATFDAAVFADAGPRLIRLADLGASLGEEVRFFVLRFAEHKLYVRVVSGGFLGVLLSLDANVSALKAAAGLVSRRVDALLQQQKQSGLPMLDRSPQADSGQSLTRTLPSIAPVELPPLPPPVSVLEVPSSDGAPRRTLRFRGRRVD